jgi:hypothetical protein
VKNLIPPDDDVELRMTPDGVPSTNDIRDLLVGRPGWRLESRSSPGSTPLWCFVFNGKIEFSVTVDEGGIRLYVMETDQEIIFDDAATLMAWLRANRVEATLDPEVKASRKSVFRRMTEWS